MIEEIYYIDVEKMIKIQREYIKIEKTFFEGIACSVCNARKNTYFRTAILAQNKKKEKKKVRI